MQSGIFLFTAENIERFATEVMAKFSRPMSHG